MRKYFGNCQRKRRRNGVVKLSRKWQCGPMTNEPPTYRGYRFPPEIISHAVWLYYRFGLSFRDVEELLAERGWLVRDTPASCDLRRTLASSVPGRSGGEPSAEQHGDPDPRVSPEHHVGGFTSRRHGLTGR